MSISVAYSHIATLCAQAHGKAFPNPNVAAAIYSSNGDFISDGFHDRSQSLDHAEIVALKKAGERAKGATMFVSLEPCAHTGKTGPCTEIIKQSGISRVVYALSDPNPIAAGGAEVLRSAGISVEQVPSQELINLQRAWLHKIKANRPLMIWKIAATLDGKIAAEDKSSQWITNEDSRNDVQLLRSQSDAILIGTETALIDNPHLIPRSSSKRPTRIVMGERAIPNSYHLHNEEAPTIFIKSRKVSELLDRFKVEGFNQVFVEAGPTLGTALLAANLIDEIVLYQAPKLLGSGASFIGDLGIKSLSDHRSLELLSLTQCGSDIKAHYRVVGKI
jgi:diaminohydroxyphosphoribosylaminopyrimidine deaminase/5-amino-6-(5-phosphoribosylamino)uracil reductase